MSAAAITMVACEEDNDYSYPGTPESTRQRAQEVADSVNAINAKVDAEISRLKSMYDEVVYAICEKKLETVAEKTLVKEHYQDVCNICGTTEITLTRNENYGVVESFKCGHTEDIIVYEFDEEYEDWKKERFNGNGLNHKPSYSVETPTEEELQKEFEEYREETVAAEYKKLLNMTYIKEHNEDICSKCNMPSQIYFTIEGTKVMENFTCHGSKVEVFQYKTTFEKWCQQEGYEIPEHAEYVWPLK